MNEQEKIQLAEADPTAKESKVVSENEAAESEKRLSYNPFNPAEELKKIRELSDEESAFSEKERREIRAKRLSAFKEELYYQREGIAEIIRTLHSVVEASPEETPDNLLRKVEEMALKYRLTDEQLSLFEFCINKYHEKHETLEKYRKMYPDDAGLFEACFGRPPEDRIEVVKGPMTLFFRCFSPDDYAFAYNFYKYDDKETEVTRRDFYKANRSTGVALLRTKLEGLEGVVTMENVSNNESSCELIEVGRIKEIHDDVCVIPINSVRGNINIEVKGVGTWEMKILEFNESGEPARIQFLDHNNPDKPIIFDVALVEPVEKRDNHARRFRNVDNGEISANMVSTLMAGEKFRGWIEMDSLFLGISDHSNQGMVIRYQEEDIISVPNEQSSRQTREHEDQHHFNKLFKVWEETEGVWGIMERAIEESSTPEKATQKLIHGLVKQQRKIIGIDTAARNEILAQYKGGNSVDYILDVLADNSSYDYVGADSERIEKIPEKIKDILSKEAREIFRREISDRGIDQKELIVADEDIAYWIDSVFGQEYKNDLEKWLGSVAALEDKRYSRDEIVSILYQEPINSWPNLARRIKPRTYIMEVNRN